MATDKVHRLLISKQAMSGQIIALSSTSSSNDGRVSSATGGLAHLLSVEVEQSRL